MKKTFENRKTSEVRSLGYVDQFIDTTVQFWKACSGLEINLSSILEGVRGSMASHVVLFDYEVAYDKKAGVATALNLIEEKVTETVADNVMKCNRELSTKLRTLQDDDRIVAVVSAPPDYIDDRVEKCTSSIALGEKVECKPLRGEMQVYSTCPSCTFPASDILLSIQKAFEDDLIVDNEIIMKINYIGDRLNPTQANSSEKLVSGSRFSVTGASIGTVVVVILLVATWRRRELVKRKRKKDELTCDEKSIETILNSTLNITLNENSMKCSEEGIEIEINPNVNV